MENGQISLDLLLTILVAIIAAGMFFALIDGTKNLQEKASAQEQLDLVTSKTAAFLTSTQSLGGSKYRVELKLDEILYTDENKSPKRAIPEFSTEGNILTEQINIWTSEGTKTIYSNTQYKINDDAQIITDQIKVNGFLVITNE